jgi:hypothetical protein
MRYGAGLKRSKLKAFALCGVPRHAAVFTEETDSPGSQLASMIRSFCSVVQHRRRAVPVISSTADSRPT